MDAAVQLAPCSDSEQNELAGAVSLLRCLEGGGRVPLPRSERSGRIRHGRTAGAAVTSCAGAGAGVLVSAAHGNSVVAILLVVSSQLWTAIEIGFRCRVRWRHYRMQEDIVRAALQQPENEWLRTLLIDVASTHLDEIGDRLPVRRQLNPPGKRPRRPPDAST